MNEFLQKLTAKRLIIGGMAGIFIIVVIWGFVSTMSNTLSIGTNSASFEAPSTGISGGMRQDVDSTDSLKTVSETSYNQGGSQPSQQNGIITERKIIKNASLNMVVGSAEDAASSIKGIAERLGGFVASSNVSEHIRYQERKNGSVMIKVPADKFDAAVSEIKNLAIKIESEASNASDVTEQFMDMEARLNNMKAEEAQYLKIMERAVTIEDTLRVAQKLSDVRGRIEQLEGQLKYMSRQIDMSSINISLSEEEKIEPVAGIKWKPLFVAKESFRNMLENGAKFADAMIRFLFALPIVILWLGSFALGIYILWVLGRYFKRRFTDKSM
jgi:hypothetical protein